MNIERMLYLADQLENPTDPRLTAVNFNMDQFSTEEDYVIDAIACGTTACIGGHACILFGDPQSLINEHTAAKILDLTGSYNDRESQVGKLFYKFDLTRFEAAAAVRQMVEEYQNDGN